MPDNRDQLDRLLDSALATYSDPGPDSGLERRILDRMAADTAAAPRRRWLAWAIALPAAASLLLFIVLAGTRILHRPASAPPQAHTTAQPPAPSSEAANSLRARPAPINRAETELRKPSPRRAHLEARPAPLPKLEIFPTPQPLSPQEQALVEFATHATPSERESLIAAKGHADAPLRIDAIEIKPLEPPAAGAN